MTDATVLVSSKTDKFVDWRAQNSSPAATQGNNSRADNGSRQATQTSPPASKVTQ